MRKTKREYCLLMNLCFILLVGCTKEEEIALTQVEPQQELIQEEVTQEEEMITELVVHVGGEVVEEGVYTLPAGSRIYQAIEAAGGMREEAASSYLNQAEFLSDGQSIIVPSKDEVEQGALVSPTSSSTAQEGKININTATKEELMQLTGIGESKAVSILSYRETNGKFQTIEELKNISGIGDATFEKLREQITV
jgi:competence protein ComEA helix-hairpin-helix repeat region